MMFSGLTGRRSTAWACGVLSGLLLASGTGCAPSLRADQADAAERIDSSAFLHEHLQRQPVVTTAEAYRAMVMLSEGEDRFSSFEERESFLKSKGILRDSWNLDRAAVIDRGTVAYMVFQILQLRGGVDYNVFGRLGIGDRRYATRELIYMGLLPQNSEYLSLTGGQLAFLVGRADAYLAEHGRYPEQPVDISEEVEAQKSAAATQSQ